MQDPPHGRVLMLFCIVGVRSTRNTLRKFNRDAWKHRNRQAENHAAFRKSPWPKS